MIAKFSLFTVLMSSACLAAESQIEGPRLGYVYDRQVAAVRPILGIPGSALFGQPLSSELREAVVSPSQDFAIGIFGDDSAVGILSLPARNCAPCKVHIRHPHGSPSAPTEPQPPLSAVPTCRYSLICRTTRRPAGIRSCSRTGGACYE